MLEGVSYNNLRMSYVNSAIQFAVHIVRSVCNNESLDYSEILIPTSDKIS